MTQLTSLIRFAFLRQLAARKRLTGKVQEARRRDRLGAPDDRGSAYVVTMERRGHSREL